MNIYIYTDQNSLKDVYQRRNIFKAQRNIVLL